MDYVVERWKRKLSQVLRALWREVELEMRRWRETGRYEEPVKSPKAMMLSKPGLSPGPCLVSIAHVATKDHSDVCALGHCLRPCCCLGTMLIPRDNLSVAI